MSSMSRPPSLKMFSKIIPIIFLDRDNEERERGSPASGPGFNYNNCLDLETSLAAEICLVTARLIRVTAPVTTLNITRNGDHFILRLNFGDHFTD